VARVERVGMTLGAQAHERATVIAARDDSGPSNTTPFHTKPTQRALTKLALTRGAVEMLHVGHAHHHPIRAATSIAGARSGATPIAIASATKPSIRPVERFLLGLRLPASSSTITVLFTFMFRIG